MNKDRIEIYLGQDGDWWWRARTATGKIVCGSAEGYKRPTTAERMARKFGPADWPIVWKNKPRGRK